MASEAKYQENNTLKYKVKNTSHATFSLVIVNSYVWAKRSCKYEE
jgi:hypothetical protein